MQSFVTNSRIIDKELTLLALKQQGFLDSLSPEGLVLTWSYLVIPSLATSFSSVNFRMPCGIRYILI